MKTIITGGAGFIGSNAASRYLRRNDHVVRGFVAVGAFDRTVTNESGWRTATTLDDRVP